MEDCKKKCDKKDCFEITNETYHLCIKKETELNFDADMGYVREKVVLRSPNGTRYKISVDDEGNISTTAMYVENLEVKHD